jgi:hypothetical protein
MYRNDYIVKESSVTDSIFPLWEVCGRWKSTGGSPGLRIYFTGRRYMVEFSYDHATVFHRPIFRQEGQPYFYLYEQIDLSYNAARDVLTLSCYGKYIRAED